MKRAVVLAGGGALGAFEIGVWRYLEEHHIDYQIVTGTSIGAINAAFMAERAYEKAVGLWKHMSVDKVMNDGFNLSDGFLNNIDKAKRAELLTFAKSYLAHGGADVAPLYELVHKSIDVQAVKASGVHLGIVACSYPDFKEHDFLADKLSEQKIYDALLASSACYPIFPPYVANKKKYVDGGYKNNLPIDLALKMGADEVIAVCLDPYEQKNPQHFELCDWPFVKLIRPSHPIGSFMDFTEEQGVKNIEHGYLEARKRFGELWGYRYTFEKDPRFVDDAHEFILALAPHLTLPLDKALKTEEFEGKLPQDELGLYLRCLEKEAQTMGVDADPLYSYESFHHALKKAFDTAIEEPHIDFFKQWNFFNRVTPKDTELFLISLEERSRHGVKEDFLNRFSSRYPEAYAASLLVKQSRKRH
jgi:predicted acylesterase/phospholipase RssA